MRRSGAGDTSHLLRVSVRGGICSFPGPPRPLDSAGFRRFRDYKYRHALRMTTRQEKPLQTAEVCVTESFKLLLFVF